MRESVVWTQTKIRGEKCWASLYTSSIETGGAEIEDWPKNFRFVVVRLGQAAVDVGQAGVQGDPALTHDDLPRQPSCA